MRIATKMKLDKLEDIIEIPPKVTITVNGYLITVKGEKGEVTKKITDPSLKIKINENEIIVFAENATKTQKTLIYTLSAHIKNMLNGVTKGHKYILKICASHFPMNVAVANNQVIIKNFIGEKIPRIIHITPGTSVKVQDTEITVEGIDLEKVSQLAASIEQSTRRANFDKRRFMDGIYITHKDGKSLA